MILAPRLSDIEWQQIRRRRLVGPKLAGKEVPCIQCGASFVRKRGTRDLCFKCSQAANTRRQNERRASKKQAKEDQDALAQWIEDERAEYASMDPFQQGSYEYELRQRVADQRDREREEANLYGSRLEERDRRKIDEAFASGDGFQIEQPLEHALSPDGPDEGYSTYFLPRTEEGYLEADVNWEWRVAEAAKWWRENPHAFSDL